CPPPPAAPPSPRSPSSTKPAPEMMTTIARSHRSVESHLQGPVGASGSFAPESQPGSRGPRDRDNRALNRHIDHLLDQRRIKRHAIPSDTSQGSARDPCAGKGGIFFHDGVTRRP